MLTHIHPKLPMRNKSITCNYYIGQLGFKKYGSMEYHDYLMLEKENIQIHFFTFAALNPLENYGQVYIRCNNIDQLYQHFIDNNVAIHPNGHLSIKPWGQKEFSLIDPDNNLLSFGQEV